MLPFEVLYEDNHLLVVDKPAGWVTQGAQPDQPSILAAAGAYLKNKYKKPGNVFLGVVSRLDRPVSGVLPLARTSKAAARLSEQIRDRTVEKRYWAIVEGKLPAESLTLKHWLVRREADIRTQCHDRPVADAQEGILHLRRLVSRGPLHWLEIELESGRKHQIRAQLAHIGCPILGDERYGSKRRLADGIGLHCRSFRAEHPTRRGEIFFKAPVPDTWSISDPELERLLEDAQL